MKKATYLPMPKLYDMRTINCDTAIEKALMAYVEAYNREREKKLTEAVLELEDGRMPTLKEIARRAHRVFFPDGRIIVYWDTTPILIERDSWENEIIFEPTCRGAP